MDVKNRLTESEITDTVDFCYRAFIPIPPEQKESVLRKMQDLKLDDTTSAAELEASLSPEELRIMNSIRARQMLRSEDTINIDTFSTDTINGLTANLKTGELGLTKPVAEEKGKKEDVLALLMGENKMRAAAGGEGQEQVAVSAH